MPRELKTDLDVLEYAREVIIRHRETVSQDRQEARNLLQLLLHISDIKAILVHDGKITLTEEER